jgi:eukaryotic-like serine/threonine-protein kinase
VPWAPGSQIGRYHLLAKIATGGMAEIWLADQAGLKGFQKSVVIKRILESFTANPEFVTMFLDEARIAAQLNHPNVVQIFDLGELSGAYYIAMEYLPGENVSSVVRASNKKKVPLPIGLATKIVSDAAAGLGHAHTKRGSDGKPLNVVHRDVSPHNLIVTLDGNTKVVDFGVARAANRATQTTDGNIKGKVAYMSPEQAMGDPLDARSDVFSLGIVLFETTTGTRFFEDKDPSAMIGILIGGRPLPVARDRNPNVPAELNEIISTALSRDLSKRYPNGTALHDALEAWLHKQPEQASTSAVAAHLKQLFAEEWAKRTELIEAARAGNLTPSGLRKSLKPDTDASMPGGTVAERRPASGSRSMIPWLAGAIGVGLGLAVLLMWRTISVPAPDVPAVIELPYPEPAVAKSVRVRIETEPAGAEVAIDGKVRGTAPIEVTDVGVGDHEVSATLAGHMRATRKLTIQEEGERAQVMLSLAPVAVAAPAPVVRDAPSKSPAAAPAAVGKGKLTLQTTPWTVVFLGGKRLGETPLLDYPLPAGRHTLRLENNEENVKTSVEIEITAGKTTVKKLSF